MGDDKSLFALADPQTIKLLQYRAPGVSTSDAEFVQSRIHSGEAFGMIEDQDAKSRIVHRLMQLRYPIPSLHTLRNDASYLQCPLVVLKVLLQPPRRVTTRDLLIQMLPDEYKSTFNQRFQYIILYLFRNFPLYGQKTPGKDHRNDIQPQQQHSQSAWRQLLALFRDLDFKLTRKQYVRVNAEPDEVFHEQISSTSSTSALWVSEFKDVPLKERSGIPKWSSHELDKDHLRFEELKCNEGVSGRFITSFFMKRSMLSAFLWPDEHVKYSPQAQIHRMRVLDPESHELPFSSAELDAYLSSTIPLASSLQARDCEASICYVSSGGSVYSDGPVYGPVSPHGLGSSDSPVYPVYFNGPISSGGSVYYDGCISPNRYVFPNGYVSSGSSIYPDGSVSLNGPVSSGSSIYSDGPTSVFSIASVHSTATAATEASNPMPLDTSGEPAGSSLALRKDVELINSSTQTIIAEISPENFLSTNTAATETYNHMLLDTSGESAGSSLAIRKDVELINSSTQTITEISLEHSTATAAIEASNPTPLDTSGKLAGSYPTLQQNFKLIDGSMQTITEISLEHSTAIAATEASNPTPLDTSGELAGSLALRKDIELIDGSTQMITKINPENFLDRARQLLVSDYELSVDCSSEAPVYQPEQCLDMLLENNSNKVWAWKIVHIMNPHTDTTSSLLRLESQSFVDRINPVRQKMYGFAYMPLGSHQLRLFTFEKCMDFLRSSRSNGQRRIWLLPPIRGINYTN
jgi:Protein of unknown function (DUF3723)